MSDPTKSARISPTAHYTGYVWQRNGLAHPALRTAWGRLMFMGLQPVMAASAAVNHGLTLEAYLIHRHRVIDHLLTEGIARGEIGQVLEIAAGLSGRGLRFAHGHADLVYVEADLPGMAARKRRLLDGAGLRGPRHHVVDIDALADDGPLSIFNVTEGLFDPKRGTAIITEGLLNYFDHDNVVGMWDRWVRFLGGFPHGMYLADLHLELESTAFVGANFFRRSLEMFARGFVHFHFHDAPEARAALRAAGFGTGDLHATNAFCETLGLRPIGGPQVGWIVDGRTGG